MIKIYCKRGLLMSKRDASKNQIIRKDGSNCFVEVLNSAFNIGRVILHFVSYDVSKPVGSRFTNEVTIYCTFEEFFRISHDLLISKKLLAQMKQEQMKAEERSKVSGKKEYAYPIPLLQGGTSEKALAAKGKARPDGLAVARILKIFPGYKLPIMFKAEQGPGKSNPTGLIVPVKGAPLEQVVQIGLSMNDCEELFLLTEKHIEAYLSSKYIMEALHPSENNYSSPKNSTPNNVPANTYSAPTPSVASTPTPASNDYSDSPLYDEDYLASLMANY